MAVVTVNRVQDLYLNNVYTMTTTTTTTTGARSDQVLDSSTIDESHAPVPAELLALDDLFRQGSLLDEAFYREAVRATFQLSSR